MTSIISEECRRELDAAYRHANRAQGQLGRGDLTAALDEVKQAVEASSQVVNLPGTTFSPYTAKRWGWSHRLLLDAQAKLIIGEPVSQECMSRAISLLADVACLCHVRDELVAA